MTQSIIEIKNLAVRFPGPEGKFHEALTDLSLNIHKGEIYGIIGMSGAGKSTLIRCLIGLQKPTAGEICFQGNDIVTFSESQLRAYRQKIGMVFQNFHLFPSRTVGENVAFAMEIHNVCRKIQNKRIDDVLELVNLSHKKNVYPSCLSGGEKQRVGIARALVNQPDILFCDEATSALDPKTMGSLLDLLQQLNERLGVTIIAITHQMEVVKQICTKVAVLSSGRLVEEGKIEDLFSSPKNMATRQLLHAQLPDIPVSLSGENRLELFRISFKGASVKEPIISRLLKLFNVEINILQANIDSFQKVVFGELIVEIAGDEEEKDKALAYLKQNHISWELL